MASTIMYPVNRWFTHIIIMSMSLAVTAGSRPYVDNESNMVAILFCVIDIFGAVSAWQSSGVARNAPNNQWWSIAYYLELVAYGLLAYGLLGMLASCCRTIMYQSRFIKNCGKKSISFIFSLLFGLPIIILSISGDLEGKNDSSPGFQIIFILALIFALIVVVALALNAIGERIRILNDAMLHDADHRAIWKAYTTCEVIFLLPILLIVFVVSFLARLLCCLRKKKKQKLTSILPSTALDDTPTLTNATTNATRDTTVNVITRNKTEQNVTI